MLLVPPLSRLALVTRLDAVLRDATAAAALRCRGCHPTRRWRRRQPGGRRSETRALDQAPVADPGRFRKLDSACASPTSSVLGPEVGAARESRRSGCSADPTATLSTAARRAGERPGGGTLSLGGDASEDFTPFLFTVGDGKALRGIEDGVRGMRQGGVRRLVLPLKTETAPRTRCRSTPAGSLPAGFGLAAAARARAREAGPVQLLHVRGRGGEGQEAVCAPEPFLSQPAICACVVAISPLRCASPLQLLDRLLHPQRPRLELLQASSARWRSRAAEATGCAAPRRRS